MRARSTAAALGAVLLAGCEAPRSVRRLLEGIPADRAPQASRAAE